jgi:hypothetical protein
MPELNKANRQVCDVDIRFLDTKKPFMFFDTANTTTVGLTGDSVYAMKKGTRAVAFQNPIEGTLTIEAQVVPFKFFAMLSDGVVENTAMKAVKKTIKATSAGSLSVPGAHAGTVYVFAEGDFGGTEIEGTFASDTFTATTAEDIVADTNYEVGYITTKTTGIQKVSFNNKKIPRDYFITMSTLEKAEDGTMIPFIITAYKATINRDFEMSFNSEGDPISYSATYSLLEDKDGNVMDILEDTSED